MRYSIVLTTGTAQYSAYIGNSFRAAAAAVDTARSILILTGGTATISARYDGAAMFPIYEVVDGNASAKNALRGVK